MRPLQDQCNPTPLPELQRLFEQETGYTMDEAFASFDQEAIGVASLAQVHKATDKQGRAVAVKLMHPDLGLLCLSIHFYICHQIAEIYNAVSRGLRLHRYEDDVNLVESRQEPLPFLRIRMAGR